MEQSFDFRTNAGGSWADLRHQLGLAIQVAAVGVDVEVLLSSSVHLIEIDFLRGGVRMPVEGLAQCAYAIMVSRSSDRPKVGLFQFSAKLPCSEGFRDMRFS